MATTSKHGIFSRPSETESAVSFRGKRRRPTTDEPESKRKRPTKGAKVYVTVENRFGDFSTRRRTDQAGETKDTAGETVTLFTGEELVSRLKNHVPTMGFRGRIQYLDAMRCRMHREGEGKVSDEPATVPISSYTARGRCEDGQPLHDKIMAFLTAEHRRGRTFIGPAYRSRRTGAISDTQLYVSGGFEERDGKLWITAQRELAEEIGMPILVQNGVLVASKMAVNTRGDTWYHVVV